MYLLICQYRFIEYLIDSWSCCRHQKKARILSFKQCVVRRPRTGHYLIALMETVLEQSAHPGVFALAVPCFWIALPFNLCMYNLLAFFFLTLIKWHLLKEANMGYLCTTGVCTIALSASSLPWLQYLPHSDLLVRGILLPIHSFHYSFSPFFCLRVSIFFLTFPLIYLKCLE